MIVHGEQISSLLELVSVQLIVKEFTVEINTGTEFDLDTIQLKAAKHL